MKIAIIGYSGSGKSTLAKRLGEYYSCEVLHLDRIHFSSDWTERADEAMLADLKSFLEKESWVIDGNYNRMLYQERMKSSDCILFLNFNRFTCLFRAFKRYQTYKGKVRPDMADGCREKLDWEFIRWILFDSRKKKRKDSYKKLQIEYCDKMRIFKNQRQLDRFLRTLKNSQTDGSQIK